MKYLPFEEKVRIIFTFQIASIWSAVDSLYKSCVSDSRFEVKLMWIDERRKGDRAQMDSARKYLEDNAMDYEIFEHELVTQFRPHYMVYQTPYEKGHRSDKFWSARYRRMGIRIIYVPYGIEISNTPDALYKHFGLPTELNAFRIYVLSEKYKAEYEENCINKKAVRATGLPRFDSLCEKSSYALPDTLKRRINGRKIVLWKAHFPKVIVQNRQHILYTPNLDEYLKFIKYIQNHTEIFFIFMPHPKFLDKTVDVRLRPKARDIVANLNVMENVYIDWADDYRCSLMNADAIIVDRSTVMIEAGLVGCPVLYMHNANYNEPMTPPVAAILSSYEQGARCEDMERFCNAILSGLDCRREIRLKTIKEYIPHRDGKCGEIIKEDLWNSVKVLEEVGMPFSIDHDARIVIFGTGNIANFCFEYLADCPGGNVIAYADNDFYKQGNLKENCEIIAPCDIPLLEFDYVVIAIEEEVNQIYRQLTEDIKIPSEKILVYDQYIVLRKYYDDKFLI